MGRFPPRTVPGGREPLGETRRPGWSSELRRRAEERLPGEPAPVPDDLDPAELLHEVRVQQVELELQNEELQRKQRELELAHHRYFDLYHSAPVAYLTLDPMGIILEANDTATAMLLLAPEQILQRKLAHLVQHRDEEEVERHLAEVFVMQRRSTAEVRLRRSDGHQMVVRLESLPIGLHNGDPDRCRASLVDITELRRKEAAMRRLATAVADSDDAIFTLDLDGRIRSWNRGARELFGLSEKQALGGSFYQLVPDPMHGDFADILNRLGGGERFRALDAERIASDGRTLFVSMTASPLRSNGWLTHTASFIERDITMRRLAESALVERELRLRAVVDAALDGIIVATRDGRIEQLNPAAERLFGCTTAEMRGAALELLVAPPAPPLADMVGSGCKLLGSRRDGAVFPIHIAVGEMKLPDRLLYCAFVRDLTSEVELQEELRQSQKMEVLGALAGGIAHDFNNVLQAIAGNAALALERMPAGDPLAPWVEQCHRAALQGGQLTHRLLAFQRRGSSPSRPIAIDRIIESYAELARHFLGDDIRLATRLGAPQWAVLAEEGHLEQILLNLVVNARDAMPVGGTIHIESEALELDPDAAQRIGLEPAVPVVRLNVKDSGRGMDDETQRRLFEPFFTTKERGRGTGLGLSIVNTIVQQIGARVEVESCPGRGTSFLFHFPAVPVPVAAEAEPGAARTGPGARVLLADDDPRVREVVGIMLRQMGHKVTAAEGGVQMLQLITDVTSAPDLLLTDVMMPEISGPSLAEKVRDRFPGIRVLFMSAVSADWLVAEGRLDPLAPVIVKPFDQKLLARRIDEVLLGDASAPETILLVEDSPSARDALSYILSESGYRVLAAESVAEARLLGQRAEGTIDFLLTDLHLPDGQGEELARELAAAHPTMRRIFMSGGRSPVSDPDSVYFVKPIDVDALIDELERPR